MLIVSLHKLYMYFNFIYTYLYICDRIIIDLKSLQKHVERRDIKEEKQR